MYRAHDAVRKVFEKHHDHACRRHQFNLDLIPGHHPERPHGFAHSRGVLPSIFQLLRGCRQQSDLRRSALVLTPARQSCVVGNRLIDAGQIGRIRGGGPTCVRGKRAQGNTDECSAVIHL